MSETVITSDISLRRKPTMASSPVVGLTVRGNGEERMKVLDNHGGIFNAEIPAPTVAPTVTGDGTGNLTHNKWWGYVYVYAATRRYPNVENINSIGGSLAPRSNPSPITTKRAANPGNRQFELELTKPTRADLNEIWIFRTTALGSEDLAQTAAEAGQMFYLGKVEVTPGAGTVTYTDNTLADGTDEIELDNFAGPTVAFVVYSDPYWYGFGNFPLDEEAEWDEDGIATLQTGEPWFDGRNNQTVKLEGVNVGGYDGLGTFYFQWLTSTTAQLLDGSDGDPVALTPGSGRIVVQGPPVTLYRSKFRNPWSWGETEIIGNLRIPEPWVFKVGGGRGTGIFTAPGLPYLILSTEYPAGMYSLDLRAAGTDSFKSSKNTLSEQYSVSVHWSQFAATRPEDKAMVMWGLDVKNFCIIECDGNTIRVVSDKVSKTLRQINTDPVKQLLSHGIYEPYHQLNCMWFPTGNSLTPVNWLVFQHVPTGNWYFNDDKDILCSALYQNPAQNVNMVFVGTSSGLVGQAFVAGKFWDWIDSETEDTLKGRVGDGTTTTIELPNEIDPDAVGLVGAWVLVTDADGQQEQWARISEADETELTFDLIYPYTGGVPNAFNPVPIADFRFYMGLIESTAIKYLNFGQPSSDKKFDEIFATLQNVGTFEDEPSTFLKFYRDRQLIAIEQTSGTTHNFLKQISLQDSTFTDGWITEFPYTEELKVVGLQIVDRGYQFWNMFDWTLRGKLL